MKVVAIFFTIPSMWRYRDFFGLSLSNLWAHCARMFFPSFVNLVHWPLLLLQFQIFFVVEIKNSSNCIILKKVSNLYAQICSIFPIQWNIILSLMRISNFLLICRCQVFWAWCYKMVIDHGFGNQFICSIQVFTQLVSRN